MATIKQGILGGFSGKVGAVVGTSWKGIAVMKAKPLSVANPKTSAQVAQRGKLSFAVELASPLLSTIIKPLWDRFAVQQSGYNAFVSTNISTAVSWIATNFAALKMSQGKMSSTPFVVAQAQADSGVVVLTWSKNNLTDFQGLTDKVFVTIINEDKQHVQGFATAATRNSETVTVTQSVKQDNQETLHVYLSFLRADGTIVSNSAYVLKAL
jgi:hypothetical protein